MVVVEQQVKTEHRSIDDRPEVSEEQTVVRRDVREEMTALQVVSRVLWVVFLFFMGLLAIRFLLALFGANINSSFGEFVYNITSPLVAPFRGMFGTATVTEGSRLEVDTVLSLVVYGFLGGIVAAILRRRDV